MRPTKLILTGFGPYAGRQEIPMEKLGTSGLYLICGVTGAGKTTIFDGITFALFGEPSGGNRSKGMLRSKYAKKETPTEVELTFLHGQKEYYIKRNPEYDRPKSRGEGFTTQKADALMELPDGRVITKANEVNAFVVELLGMNRDQFSRIALLAQGDFMKLLMADTAERQRIFRELFKTGFYETLQEMLKAKAGELGNSITDTKKSLNQYIQSMTCPEDSVKIIEVEKAKQGLLTTEEVLNLFDEVISIYGEKSGELGVRLSSVEEKIKKQVEIITNGENIQKTKQALMDLKKKYEEEKSREEAVLKTFNEAASALEMGQELNLKKSKIEGDAPRYDELDLAMEDEKKLKENIEKGKSYNEKLKKETESFEETIIGQKERYEKIKDKGEEKQLIINKLDNITSRLSDIAETIRQIKDYGKKLQELKQLQEIYLASEDAFRTKNSEYDAKHKAYMDGQSGILAKTLVQGMPCPVCGSTEHPAPATEGDDSVSREEVEALKKEVEKLRLVAEEDSKKCGNKKVEAQNLMDNIKKLGNKLFSTEDFDKIKTSLSKEDSSLKATERELSEKVKEIEKLIKEREILSQRLPEYEKKLSEKRDRYNEVEKQVLAFETSLKERQEGIAKLKGELVFPDKKSAMEESQRLSREFDKLKSAKEAAEANYTKFKEDLINIQGSIKSYESQLEDSKEINLEEEKRVLKELEIEKTGLLNLDKEISASIHKNKEARENIEKKGAELLGVEEEYTWVSNLSKTLNGNLGGGKERITLETYVQTTYFERILRRANLRLLKMTDSQYELKRQPGSLDNRSQTGLELLVRDHYNGSERSVKTLSGGESFLASLSLALGLSDEIQSMSGGIQIETMFVDEGFGSLDADTLDMAYKALSGLTEGNRLVGIISHVGSLREKIDKQILVEKDRAGGSSARIISG